MVKWLIGGVLVLAMVAGCMPVADTGGRESRESLVKAYLAALQAGDADAMLSLVGPGVDARADVADAIQHGGGKEGIFILATVQGLTAVDGSTFETTIPMSRENGRYYLGLGQATPTGSESDTSSPSAVP